MKLIPLGREMFAKVDDANFEWLSQWKRFAFLNRNRWYARRADWSTGKNKAVWMHREILGLKEGDGIIVDHRNSDSLDNQRENLRAVTCLENNRPGRAGGAVDWGFVGIGRFVQH